MTGAWAEQLWHGPLANPEEPALQLVGVLQGAADYSYVLQQLAILSSHGISTQPALDIALSRWPWSIDLALLLVTETDHGEPALQELEQRVRQQNRRFGALAWAIWATGDRARAQDAVQTLDPASQSHEADSTARSELAILAGQPSASVPGPNGVRLSLLETWYQADAVALARRFDLEHVSYPAAPALWSWLIDAFVTERDFARAAAALGHFTQVCGHDHPEVVAQTIRLALDREDHETARAVLKPLTKAPPWLWPARLHGQHLRCWIAEIAQSATPDFAPAHAHAAAAHRLFPRNGHLNALWLSLREMAEDWDDLAQDLMAGTWEPTLASGALLRLGLPDQAAHRLAQRAAAAPGSDDRSTLQGAIVALRSGALPHAEQALGAAPRVWPHNADHAYWAAEIALARRDIPTAKGILNAALSRGPTRMGLILNAARAAYFAGDYAAALCHLDRFRALKTAHLGVHPTDDLRDKIVQDAANAQVGGVPDTQSPGLAARVLALSPPDFTPSGTPPIPHRIAHYWEGPRSLPVDRGLRQWARMHPNMAQTCFGPTEAARWLAHNAPSLCALFDRQTQPATRADLFRIALIAVEGGIFADLDEYPRQPVTPWLDGARAVLVIEEGHGTVANNFLAATPGLPLFARLLTRITARLKTVTTPYPWWDCGPAQVTLEALSASRTPTESAGLRFLSQAAYDARVSTNLPYPHKRGAGHWR